jgi:anti-anti-sigma regulatory factor
MNIKSDTKEKFTVITLDEPVFAANMSAEFSQLLETVRQSDPGNAVLNMQSVQSLEAGIPEQLAQWQQSFYEQERSMVICCLQPGVEKQLDELEILELLNCTPTESEAWDIVQMEEIEREMLNGFDEDESS